MTFIKRIHHLLNPHCPDCRLERQEQLELQREINEKDSVCDSCETLKLEVARLRLDNEKLLDKILEPSHVETVHVEPPAITKPAVLPWKVRQQILEKEDREKARSMREAAKPDSVESLEKELGVAEKERESSGTINAG